MLKNATIKIRAKATRLKGGLQTILRDRKNLRSEDFHANMHLLKSIEQYCMFIGYGRSGHSLIGSLLDAHPQIVIAHELDALKYLGKEYTREQIFYLILQNSKSFAEQGRSWSNYSYTVPNQWQGRFTELKVIGDKKAGVSTYLLHRNPDLLKKITDTFGRDTKFIHILRNPFDILATKARGGNDKRMHATPKRMIEAFERLTENLETIHQLKKQIENQILDIKQEDFIENPKKELKKLIEFLGLEAPQDYLDDCAGIVFKKAHQSRHDIKWPPGLIERIEKTIAKYDFLKGYTFT